MPFIKSIKHSRFSQIFKSVIFFISGKKLSNLLPLQSVARMPKENEASSFVAGLCFQTSHRAANNYYYYIIIIGKVEIDDLWNVVDSERSYRLITL
jgi:hypothetical protein